MKNSNKQSGAVLVVSLIILLLLTMLGVTSMESTVLQEKMAGNSNDYNRALQAAEVGLREGENWISDLSSAPAASGSPTSTEVWFLDGPAETGYTTMWWDHVHQADVDWWPNNAVQSTATLENVTTEPYYVNEELSFVKDSLTVGTSADTSGRSVFRVTSRGSGGNDLTVVLLQSTYSRRF